jgi:Ice-binding-like
MTSTSRLLQVALRLTVPGLLALLLLAACGPSPASPGPRSQPGLASALQLGTASRFAVLGASTVTCTAGSTVTGDVGLSPGTSVTGFNPDCTVAGTIHAGDAVAIQAHADLATAYDALGAPVCQHNLTGQDLGGQTLAPGIYCFDTTVGLTGQLTLDGGGDSAAVWIFQVGTAVTTATGASVVMAGGGQACNVFWKLGSSATLGTGTAFEGNLLASASITLVSGSSLVGRALAVNAAVTMDHNTVALATCSP